MKKLGVGSIWRKEDQRKYERSIQEMKYKKMAISHMIRESKHMSSSLRAYCNPSPYGVDLCMRTISEVAELKRKKDIEL